MKQLTAMTHIGQAAPYQLVPDYRAGLVLPDELSVLYTRLSKGDKDKLKEDDSDSIVNQKKMLGNYALENRLPNPIFFTDDDITGTTFDREQFQAAIALVEAGRVKNFVVKDMSRFGRDYLKVGFYTEVLFPDKEVRFIALNDHVDSAKGKNDLTPFRNLFNEWYARDTSEKIRAVFRSKGLAGEHLGWQVPYGYQRDPQDPKHWVVDPEAAEVVRQIFRLCLGGLGVTHIAHRLRDMKVETPAHRAMVLGAKPTVKPPDNPYDWVAFMVGSILSRREYLGHTVNFKTRRKSYKNKKTIFNDPSEYAVFEDTHEAIVDQETFDRVQQLRAAGKRRHDSSGRLGLFSGLAYCADCKSKLYLSSGASKTPEQDNYACSGFRTKKQNCHHSHYIRRVVLEGAVLEYIQRVTAFYREYEQEFVELLKRNGADKSHKELTAMKRKLAGAERRIVELDNIIQRLYEDKIATVLTEERFVKLSKGYEREQQELQTQTADLARQVETEEQKTLDVSRFLAQVRKHANVTELTPTMLNELVERVEVHAPDKSSGKRVQQIDIILNFVGIIDELELANPGK